MSFKKLDIMHCIYLAMKNDFRRKKEEIKMNCNKNHEYETLKWIL